MASGGGGTINSPALMRYGSAPSSLLSTAVDSVIGSTREFSALGSTHHHRQPQNLNMGPNPTPAVRFFPIETSSFAAESNCKVPNNTSTDPHKKGPDINNNNNNSTIGLQRSYGLKQDAAISGGGVGMVSFTPLVRHSSSPAGFLNQLAHASTSNDDNGFSITRGHAITRLNSQLSFTRQEPLSQISEENENGLSRETEAKKSSTHSYATTSYGVGPWEDANSLMFSVGPSKRAKNINSEIINDLNSMETQFQFSMPQTVIEMSTMDKLLNIPQDSVPCKIRAKRGFATHPRSIAERERRTRISGKLKKLQELVPNMDKQTSYADMLDLAVQHIKGLQNHVQKLNKELENCTCGCRKPRNCGGEGKS